MSDATEPDEDLAPAADADEPTASGAVTERPDEPDPGGVGAVQLDVLEPSSDDNGANSLELLSDVEIELTVRIGIAHVPLKQLRGLSRGSLIILDRQAGSDVDILANGTIVGQGELVTVDGSYGVRISRLVAAKQSALQA